MMGAEYRIVRRFSFRVQRRWLFFFWRDVSHYTCLKPPQCKDVDGVYYHKSLPILFDSREAAQRYIDDFLMKHERYQYRGREIELMEMHPDDNQVWVNLTDVAGRCQGFKYYYYGQTKDDIERLIDMHEHRDKNYSR